jgi:hypothetical protein
VLLPPVMAVRPRMESIIGSANFFCFVSARMMFPG